MSAADRLDQIEARVSDTSPWVSKHDVADLVAALRAVLELAKEMEADIPHDGNNTAANHTGRLIRTAIEEALS